MTTPFMTPASTGFNDRGPHPKGRVFGGATTPEASLVRAGRLVIREVDWHDDDEGDLGMRAPFLVTGIVGPTKEAIGVEGYFLLTGDWLMRWNRAWPGGSKSNAYRDMPDFMDSDGVFVVDFDWKTYIPLQDVRGSLRAVPVVLDEHGDMANGPVPKGTIVLAGGLRTVLDRRIFEAVRTAPAPELVLPAAVLANIEYHSVHLANAFGVDEPEMESVPASVGPQIPGTRRHVMLGADFKRGFVDGAIIYGSEKHIAVVFEATESSLRCWKTFAPPSTLDPDPGFGGRDGELMVTEFIVTVPITEVRSVAKLVTRQLYSILKGTTGCPLFWFERKRMPCGRILQFYPPSDAELDEVVDQWSEAGQRSPTAPAPPTAPPARVRSTPHAHRAPPFPFGRRPVVSRRYTDAAARYNHPDSWIVEGAWDYEGGGVGLRTTAFLPFAFGQGAQGVALRQARPRQAPHP